MNVLYIVYYKTNVTPCKYIECTYYVYHNCANNNSNINYIIKKKLINIMYHSLYLLRNEMQTIVMTRHQLNLFTKNHIVMGF